MMGKIYIYTQREKDRERDREREKERERVTDRVRYIEIERKEIREGQR